MENNTEVLPVGEEEYTLRLRLGWYEQEKVDGKAFRLFTEGSALSDADDLSDLEQVEIVMNTAEHSLARLQARVMGLNRQKVKAIPPPHVAVLLARIEELEKEQEAERQELMPGNPTETQSGE